MVLKESINGQDFIDASQISDSGNIVIATQCPLQTTIAHFLQMLTDQKIDSIVMLTKTYEQRLGNDFKDFKFIRSSIRLQAIYFFPSYNNMMARQKESRWSRKTARPK